MKDSGLCIIFPSFLPVSWHTEACDDNTAGLAHQQLEASLRQRTEDRGQRTEDGGQRTEDRGRRTEDRGWTSEDRGRMTDDG